MSFRQTDTPHARPGFIRLNSREHDATAGEQPQPPTVPSQVLSVVHKTILFRIGEKRRQEAADAFVFRDAARVPRLAVVAPGSAALRLREFCVTCTRAIKPVCVRLTHRGVQGGRGHVRCTSMHARCTPDVRGDVRWLIRTFPFPSVPVRARALRRGGTAGHIVQCEFSCSRTDGA